VAFSPGGGFDSVSIPVGTPRLWCGTILFVPALAKSFYTTSRHTGKIVLSDRACDWPNDCVLSKTRGVHVELEEEISSYRLRRRARGVYERREEGEAGGRRLWLQSC